MNASEFRDWFDHHVACFPDLRGWMKRNTPSEGPDDNRPIRAWEKALSSVSLGLARDATDAMFAGNIPDPRGFSRHPAAVIDYCRSRVSSVAPGDAFEGTAPCVCVRGYLTVIDDAGMKWSVLCTCARGDHRADMHRRAGAKPMRRYQSTDRLESEFWDAT